MTTFAQYPSKFRTPASMSSRAVWTATSGCARPPAMLRRRPGEESPVNPTAIGPSLLFCAASRPDRLGKYAECAGIAILGIEDAVRPEGKKVARTAVAAAVSELAGRAIVRGNAIG